MLVLETAVSLLPVCAFLLLLVVLDSFKLVPTRTLIRALLLGAGSAATAGAFHAWLLEAWTLDPRTLSAYVAPLSEETVKAACFFYFLRRRYIGFLVDAAILGFAIGAGFAVVENLDYLRSWQDRRILLWTVRGFGTAILHGATTAIVGISTKSLAERRPQYRLAVLLPGWMAAVVMHSAFNQALVSPILAAAILMAVLPLVVLFVFSQSERATREWIGAGLDLDFEQLNRMLSAGFDQTRVSAYLFELKSRFPGAVVADMFCLLRLQLELSIRAKGMLMAREAGFALPIDKAVLRAYLDEVSYLQRSIGSVGLVALRPLQSAGDRDQWHRYLLEHAGTTRRSWWHRVSALVRDSSGS
jgi:RsiW-degrading membrane proteinase PrsW (M82 family)